MSMLIARPGHNEAEAYVRQGLIDVPTGPRIRWFEANFTTMFGVLGLGASIFGFVTGSPIGVSVFFLVLALLALGSALSCFDVTWRRYRNKVIVPHNAHIAELVASGDIFIVLPGLLEIFEFKALSHGLGALTNDQIAQAIGNYYDSFVALGNPDQADMRLRIADIIGHVVHALTSMVDQKIAERHRQVEEGLRREEAFLNAQRERLPE